MSELTATRRQELLDQLETASSDEEFAAIEAELGVAPKNSPWCVTTLRDVANFFGVHEKTVAGWRQEGCPGIEGSYDLTEVVQWRIAKAERRGSVLGDDSERELIRQERRLNIERKQLALDQERGLLGRKDELAADVSEVCGIIRTRLEAMPGEFAARFPAEHRDELHGLLRDGIRLTLKELAALGSESSGERVTTATDEHNPA